MRHEQRILWLSLVTGLPIAAIALAMLWTGDYTPLIAQTLTLIIVALWLGSAFALRRKVVFPLQTLSNLLAALREGDYSVRGTAAAQDDTLSEVTREINALADTLRWQRMDAVEATALLQKVMHEIDVVILSFDNDGRLQLVNRAGEQLLDRPWERLLGSTASELALEGCLDGETPRVADMSFPGGVGRWEIRRTNFRQGGLPHQLIVLSDVSRTLREEERRAWQRIVRVLAHELNNSLAPISSISTSLRSLLERPDRPEDWEDDIRRGLGVISSRSASLARFVESYSSVTRLPQPRFEDVEVDALVRRVVGLETRLSVAVAPGPNTIVQADGAQIEQALINLIRNAVDAALETGGGVRVGWTHTGSSLDISIEDEGPGVPNTSNLFVPFFTTKKGGSGIGLVLSRQIAEAHHGILTLDNRDPGPGCRAMLRLPLTNGRGISPRPKLTLA